MEAGKVKPAVRKESDFYSWQLYRWLKKRPTYNQIWRGTWNNVSGVDRERTVLYIGKMDEDWNGKRWLHGRLLRNLCLVGADLESYAYGPCHDTDNWEDITAEWWSEYMYDKGVCAIHGDLVHKWIVDGDTRTCEYCGKVEKSRIEMVEKVVWEDAA